MRWICFVVKRGNVISPPLFWSNSYNIWRQCILAGACSHSSDYNLHIQIEACFVWRNLVHGVFMLTCKAHISQRGTRNQIHILIYKSPALTLKLTHFRERVGLQTKYFCWRRKTSMCDIFYAQTTQANLDITQHLQPPTSFGEYGQFGKVQLAYTLKNCLPEVIRKTTSVMKIGLDVFSGCSWFQRDLIILNYSAWLE